MPNWSHCRFLLEHVCLVINLTFIVSHLLSLNQVICPCTLSSEKWEVGNSSMIYSKSETISASVCADKCYVNRFCLFNILLRRIWCDLSNLIYLKYSINFKPAVRTTGRVTGITATSLTVDRFCLPNWKFIHISSYYWSWKSWFKKT